MAEIVGRRPPAGIVARNAFAAIAAATVPNIILLRLIGAPRSVNGFALEASLFAMVAFFSFVAVDRKLVRGESGWAFMLMVLGTPAVQVVAMFIAVRVGTALPYMFVCIALMAALSAAATVLRTFR